MTLRSDLFRTVERAETRFICFRDTLTTPDPDFDIRDLDLKHCRQGRLGCGVHFLVLTNGDIQLGRQIDTVGSHSKDYDWVSVAVGVVGGIDEEGNRQNTRTEEQEETLVDTLAFLSQMYPNAELSDRPDH